MLGKYSKFASAGDKAAVRQAGAPTDGVQTPDEGPARDEEGPDAAEPTRAAGPDDAPF